MQKIIFLLLFILPLNTFSQKTKTLIFDYKYCKDATISNIPDNFRPEVNHKNMNQGKSKFNRACVWTWLGEEGTVEFLIDFDLSKLPNNIRIISAYLTLFEVENESKSCQNNDSREFYIQKIVESWDEYTVSWNTRPQISAVNRVFVPDNGNYTAINVTDLVIDKLENPENNFGFHVKMAAEYPYHSILFGAKEYPQADKRPVLTITYINGNAKNKYRQKKNDYSLYCDSYRILIYDSDFRLIRNIPNADMANFTTVVNSLGSGDYFCIILKGNNVVDSHIISK